MSAAVHLVQDLRAEAHRAPDDIARLMRDAADRLERFGGDDSTIEPPPVPPPAADDPRNPREQVKGQPSC